MSKGRVVVGIDVGGTFTDLFLFDEETRKGWPAKVPSTRGREAEGFMDGLLQELSSLSKMSTLIHGTTVGTNALLERKGAPVGVITTRGFRDVLEMRRRDRPHTWGLWGEFVPVVPRNMRLEVSERTLADGSIRTPVDPKEVQEIARELQKRGAQSIAIIFINSYANGTNENIALKAVQEIWPNDYVNASSIILPELREFERASTTALNAYLQPVVGNYLKKLENALRKHHFKGDFLIVQSNGGVMDVQTARQLPVRTALSGPAAGVIAAGYIAEAAGFKNVITCDMGGTSFDVSLIANSQSVLAAQSTIDFGMVVRTPMIEISTIGAGGGSIAWVDPGGLLRIGPESAGSIPGPVCYGQGNTRPTVTDANVVLGRINAHSPIGGKLDTLDYNAAKEAIRIHIAEPLQLSVMDAAEAIVKVADASMAGAVRLVSVEKGHDPKRFVTMPFGGGGSLHAGALIKDVGLSKALIPRYPGVTSALGCIIADMRHDFVHTINTPLANLNVAKLDQEMVETAQKGIDILSRANIELQSIDILFELDMSYIGQTHTVAVPLPISLSNQGTGVHQNMILQAFQNCYQKSFGTLLEGIDTRILSLRTAVVGKRPKFDLSSLQPSQDCSIEQAKLGTRKVWDGGTWHEASIYKRLLLPVGACICGPAVLEQPDTTIYIAPDLRGDVDEYGNIILSRMETS